MTPGLTITSCALPPESPKTNPHEIPQILPLRARLPCARFNRHRRFSLLLRAVADRGCPLNGFILHEDRDRVIIATGFETPSDNRKTGDMVQIWILVKSCDPVTAIKEGLDRLICGSCRHRGNGSGAERSCYVNVGQAPLGIWKAWKSGSYLPLPSVSIFAGRRVRFGAYGDPTHIPLSLALAIAGAASGWTGYTHQWRKPSLQAWRSILMASVDTTAELVIARSMGWSTFRVTPDLDHHTMETLCASDRDGTPCADCLACAGSRGGQRAVFIPAHGTGKRHFIEA